MSSALFHNQFHKHHSLHFLSPCMIYFNIISPSNFRFTKVHFPNGFNRNAQQAHVFLITPIGSTCKLLSLVQWLEHLLHIREFWSMVLSAVCISLVFHRYSQILQRTVGVIWWFGQDLKHTWARCYNTHVYLYSPQIICCFSLNGLNDLS